jgi:hypothetical protein
MRAVFMAARASAIAIANLSGSLAMQCCMHGSKGTRKLPEQIVHPSALRGFPRHSYAFDTFPPGLMLRIPEGPYKAGGIMGELCLVLAPSLAPFHGPCAEHRRRENRPPFRVFATVCLISYALALGAASQCQFLFGEASSTVDDRDPFGHFCFKCPRANRKVSTS